MLEKIEKKKFLSLVGICGFGLLVVYALNNDYSQQNLSNSSALDSSFRELDVVDQDLEFVHITKTGGTTIERVGCEHGFKWGSMHYFPYFNCVGPDVSGWEMGKDDYKNSSPWHTPPKILEKMFADKENPFKGSELFTIVRNPYTRFVSEYHCPFAGKRCEMFQVHTHKSIHN